MTKRVMPAVVIAERSPPRGSKEKVEIVAYILKESGFPAGTTELPATADGMKAIKIEATKPGR